MTAKFKLCFILVLVNPCTAYVGQIDVNAINVNIGTVFGVSKTSLLVTWTLNTSARLLSTIIGFELQYDNKPFFDNSSYSESLYDSSARSKMVTNLEPDTVYVFRVKTLLSVPNVETIWSNVMAAETKGSDVKVTVIFTLKIPPSVDETENWLNKTISDWVYKSLSEYVTVLSVEIQKTSNTLNAKDRALGLDKKVYCVITTKKSQSNYFTPEVVKKGLFDNADETVVGSNFDAKVFVPSDLTECADPNKEFKQCDKGCVKTCENPEPRDCMSSSGECVSGCFCKNGFVYDYKSAKCIPNSFCSNKCYAQNEVYEYCGLKCLESCSPHIRRNCRANCSSGCFCQLGHARIEGDCKPMSECAVCSLAENRVYKDCAREKYCLPNSDSGAQMLISGDKDGNCQSGCFCMDGYVEFEGKCILETECAYSCVGMMNMFFDACGNVPCVKTCDNRGNAGCNPRFISNSLCQPGCYCAEGYVLDSDTGKCILEKNCPIKCGDPNQEYRLCNDTCITQCDGSSYCDSSQICQTGRCICKPGFYWSQSQIKCVPDSQCLATNCGDPNSSFQCWHRECEPTCTHPISSCLPDMPSSGCVWGCFCKKGYVSDHSGNCVAQSECSICKKQNTVFQLCGCNPDCYQTGSKVCEACEKGCFCAEGFAEYRGYCIPKEQCPGKCPSNMLFSDCATCVPTCFDDNPTCSDCAPGCTCKSGFYLHGGVCVSKEECAEVVSEQPCFKNDRNSTYSPSIRCRPSCWDPSPPECDSRASETMDGCMCQTGYLFNGSHCVLPIDCPFSTKVCPDRNSEVVQCSRYCERSCSNPDLNACLDGLLCDSGCLCKRGYYRNSVGKCVLPEKCSICGMNMHYEECGCHRRCEGDTINSICNCFSGCFCNSGFFWLNGNCVPEDLCYRGNEIVAPQIIPTSMQRFLGEKIQFHCSTEYASSTVFWFHNSTKATLDQHVKRVGSFLDIENIQLPHAGSYQCAIEINGEGSKLFVSKAALLKIDTSLSRIQASLNASRVEAKVGAFVALQCNVRSDEPPTITWRFRGGQLPPQSKLSVAQDMRSVVILEDFQSNLEGEYSCVAYHPDGESSYAAVTVTLQGQWSGNSNQNIGNLDNLTPNNKNTTLKMDSPSYIGTEGKPMQLKCIVVGQDPLKIFWKRPGSEINEAYSEIAVEYFNDYGVSILVFPRLRRSDTGSYTCYLPKLPEVKPDTTYLMVERAKTWFELGIYPEGVNGVLTIQKGDDVTLVCHVTNGTATPTIDWYYNNSVKLPKFITVSLNTLTHKKVEQSGNYMCSGSYGSETQFVSIVVKVFSADSSTSSSGQSNGASIDLSTSNKENESGVRVIVTIMETSPFNYKVSCSVEDTDSTPVPYQALNWLFQNSFQFPRNVIPNEDAKSLLVNKARLDNEGLFTCLARLQDGTEVSGSTELSFLVDSSLPAAAPSVIVSPRVAVLEQQDQSVRLYCLVKSRTKPIQLRWVQISNQETIGSQAVLEIRGSNLGSSRHETFSCFASNFYGTNSQSVRVERIFDLP